MNVFPVAFTIEITIAGICRFLPSRNESFNVKLYKLDYTHKLTQCTVHFDTSYVQLRRFANDHVLIDWRRTSQLQYISIIARETVMSHAFMPLQRVVPISEIVTERVYLALIYTTSSIII